MAGNREGDILNNQNTRNANNQNTNSSNNTSMGGPDIDLLKSIDATLRDILDSVDDGGGISQSAFRRRMPGSEEEANKWKPNRSRRRSKGAFDEFTDAIEQELLDSVFGADVSGRVQDALSVFASGIGVELSDIPKVLGKEVGQQILRSQIGQQVSSTLSDQVNKYATHLKNKFMSGVTEYASGRENESQIIDVFNQSFDAFTNPQQRGQNSADVAEPDRVRDIADQSAVNPEPSLATTGDYLPVMLPDDISQAIIDIRDYLMNASSDSTFNPPSEDSNLGDDIQSLGQNMQDISDMDIPDGLDIPEPTELPSTGSTAGQLGADMIGEGAVVDEAIVAGEGAATAETAAVAAGEGAAVVGATEGAGAAMAGIAAIAPEVVIALAAIAAVAIAVELALDALGPAIEGTKKLFEAAGNAAARYEDSRKKNLALEQERLEADVKAMIEAPFNILKDAAEELYNAWDTQIRKINQTQGYSKADLQSLIGSYANRLRDEGLTKVVSSADITKNLANVLDSGLSGKVAEEFAYLATKLNAAIPTQDFFGYAESYAAVAANAIRLGKSEAEAIQYANSQIENFADNILFASRQIAGGFTTGLKNAQSLFDDSVKIAQASKTGDAGNISGVLTAVSAITGAIAPDLANTMVDAVVKAAVGGNSEDIVALRSLAGINASNTEFLKQLADDPKSLFEQLFNNLSRYQNQSPENYMEVAEGLSNVFGLSMDAFARIDFAYLAQAVSKMDTASQSLDANIGLLLSGQSTATAEQLKMQQINEYMLEEGLAYVLDNEVARSIQENMWAEQRARELMEATYAVELQGSALEFLEGIKETVDNIINFLNPFSWLTKGIVNLIGTAAEAAGQESDIRKLLELGKVGNGNAKDLYNLTTRNADLHLTEDIISLMGGKSAYKAASKAVSAFNTFTNFSGWTDMASNLVSGSLALSQNSLMANKTDFQSSYTWGIIGKSVADAIAKTTPTDPLAGRPSGLPNYKSTVAATQASGNLDRFLDSLSDAIDPKSGKVEDKLSFDQWIARANKYGIQDLDAALEDKGIKKSELEAAFHDQEAAAAAEYEYKRDQDESEFWAESLLFYHNEQDGWVNWESIVQSNQETMIDNQVEMIANQLFIIDNQGTMISNQDTIIDLLKTTNYTLGDLLNGAKDFVDKWVDYYVNHTQYSKDTLSAYDVAEIRNAEKSESGDAVLALANALTKNNLELKDPAVQTNVLLAKILLVAEAIMQQNNESGGFSLPDSLSALAMGFTSPSK